MALSALGLREAAGGALLQLAETLRQGDWAFQEWFHGQNLAPHGMTGQSWSAAGFLLAQTATSAAVFPFIPYGALQSERG